MNLTNEQIDALIAALEAQRRTPNERWLVADMQGEVLGIYRTRHEAIRCLRTMSEEGTYRIHHMREVLP